MKRCPPDVYRAFFSREHLSTNLPGIKRIKYNRMKKFQKTKNMLFIGLTLLLTSLVSRNSFGQSLALSVGASAGYAPLLNYGSTAKSGVDLAVFADLEYGHLIGRLQFTDVLTGTVNSSSLKSGYGFHGALGYNVPVMDQLFIPFMLTAGIGIISYVPYGSTGDQFDAGPQFGLTISPYYRITDRLSLQLAARYIHGFTVDSRSSPIHLADLQVGVRYTLGQNN